MSGSRTVLSPDELKARASQFPQWKIVEDKLTRTYTFPDFQKGLDFVNQVGVLAEKQGHHPDVHLSWGRVVIETSTHDAGGLTEQDFLLASKIDRLM